ncbi:PREDICTED: mediator of DNA damage checkpoint protein 1 isoform X2 [Chinchilla lanigera]|nr:PREDICTED: mediator of DNA damage checkpoint protein 1 isoform X2 [Chinchilla lanigera]XP_013365259.1 PREDICTED: mediator of DNA damage checkpoint protein 1 isoform X2 [Chinchilla lanigera]XP_013365260.1 PREDICTED: mediator of DNA damage checkpoint protein 1 isoform X2 [Chinchilla lanigera]
MEDTQTIDWAAEEEEETERASESSGCSLEPVGRLRVFGGTYGPEKDFPLYLGKNVIGRMPDCSVALPFPSISKQHAVIEISAQDKAPVLQDCGSLNGTQILRPPKVLSPGASHRLRDHELILLADLPCQYCRLGVPLPVVSRGPLTIEETPRVPGDAHTTRPPLAEDSEEEADFLSEGRVGRESRTASSPVTVVPESDDEGPSPVLGGSGPSLAFSLDSDTEEDEAGKAFPAARSSTTTKTEQPRGDRVTHATRLVKAPPAVGRDRDTEVRKGAGNRVVLESSHPPGGDSDSDVDEDSRPAELLLERAQPSGFEDSDTDVEEEGIPATPAAALMTRRPILHAAGAGRPGAPGLARLPESPAGSDTDVEEQKCPAAGGQTSVVINSDTDEEEEVSAALTLAQLKEGRAALWNRDTDAEKARAQPLVLEWNPTSSGRDSDTDTEEGRLPVGKRETIPSASTEKAEPLVTAQSGKSRPPRGDGEGAGRHSRGTRLKRSQACPATVHIKTEAEEEVPPGPAVTHLASHHVPVQGTNRARPPGKANMEKDLASAVAAVRKSQRVAEGDAREMAPEVRAPGRTPAAQGEQVVHTATPRDPSLLQRGRAQTPTGRRKKSCLARVRGSKDSLDAGCDDLDLQATQCFVESENLQAVPGVEDEPTQAFPCVLCPEPSTPHCSSQAPGSLDEPWEVLATQPFCVGASEHPEPLPTATLLEAHASHLSPPRAAQDECPRSRAHTEPLGTEGRGLRTVERDRGTTRETAERVTPERGTPERDITEQPPGDSADEWAEETLTRTEDREQKVQVLAGAAQRPEADRKVDSVSPGRARESLEEEGETAEDTQERDMQRESLTREALEGAAEEWVPATESGVEARSAVALERGESERGYRRPEGQGHPERQAAQVSPEPGMGVGHQSGGVRGAPVSPSGQPRGHMASKMPPAESTPRDDLESPDAGPPAAVPTALAPPSPPAPGPCISQSRKQAVPRPLLPSLPSCEPPIPRAGRTGKQKAPEPALSSELETLRPKPTARRRPRGRMTPTLLSSAAHTPHLPVPTEQPAASEPEPQTSLARTRRSSIKTPEAAEPAAPELQPSTSTHQPVAPEPAPRATRSRENRSSVKTPEAAVHTAPELRLSTATDQLVIPKTTPRATRGRTDRSSVKTPEAAESAAPELQPSTSTHQPDTREPVPRATRSRVNRSSVKTSEVADPAALELQPSTSTHQPVVPKTTPQATRSRTCRSSSETVKSVEPSATELKPPTVTAQPVKTETVAEDWVASESQPPVTTDRTVPQEPDPQACCSRRQRAAGKRGSRTAPIVHQPCSEPQDRASGDQRAGRRRAAASLGTIPDPSFSPLPEAPTHAPQIPKVEAVDSSGSTRELQPAASLRRKRPSRSTDPPPLPKQPQREASQKTVLPKNEEDDTAERPEKAEDVGIPGPGKRKRTQMEEEPQEVPKRGLRRPKPTLQSAAPKVLFTGVLDARGEQAVLALGGSLASSVAEASHLVTDRIRRTVKFLCALGKGIPVLSLAWLQQSHKAGHFLPPDQFVVTDPEQERNFGFSLRDALSRARERRLLEGYEIHVTPGVQPPPLQMGEIVSCCGGTVLPSMPRSYKPQRVVITCPQDLPRCSSASRAGLPLLSPEFLLTGVLKQEVRPEAFVLSAREPSST